MKRSKFILLALVAGLVLMGAGYAAWTQTFTISSNISTGELFVQIENVESYVEVYNGDTADYVPIGEDDSKYLGDTSDIAVDKPGDTNKTGDQTIQSLSCTLADVHPGTRITNKLSFQNLGTVKADTFINEESDFNSVYFGSPLWNDLVITVNGEVIEGSGELKFIKLKDALEAAVGTLDTEEEPKEVTIVQELPHTSENETENLSIEWKIGLTFQQAFN